MTIRIVKGHRFVSCDMCRKAAFETRAASAEEARKQAYETKKWRKVLTSSGTADICPKCQEEFSSDDKE